MLPYNRYLAAVAIFCYLLCCGCKSSHPAKPQPKSQSALRAPKTASEAELRKLAEAHAHYAAGVIEEVEERPDAALEQYKEAALRDPGNETLVLEVARRFLQNKKPEQAFDLLRRASERPNASAA